MKNIFFPNLKLKTMPEGPETQIQTDLLIKNLKINDKWLSFMGIENYSSRYPQVDIRDISTCLENQIYNITCKGKEYFIRLSKDICIHVHHKMGGQWSFDPLSQDDKNMHFKLLFAELDENNNLVGDIVSLYYINSRFGTFEFFKSEKQFRDHIDSLAHGFIGDYIMSHDDWMNKQKKFAKRKLLLVLREQKTLCSGIGNYLMAEIFYEACLNPNIKVGSIYVDDWSKLYYTIQSVVNGHYKGTREKVIYKKDICPKGYKIIGEKMSGRTMWWVPELQKL